MSNRVKPNRMLSPEGVSRIQKGYEDRIARQVEIIDRLKADLGLAKAEAAEAKGAQLIATVLLKRIGEPVVINRADLQSADASEVTVIEREDGGIYIRLEQKDV